MINRPKTYLSSCAWKLSFLITALWSCTLCAQDPKADSLRIEGYYTQLSQHCYSNLDSTLHYLDLLLADTKKLGWIEEQAYGYLWGISCTGYHDQIDLKYDWLSKAAQLLSEKGSDLAPDILAAIDLDLQMHWGDYYLETGGYNGALEIYETLAANLEDRDSLTDGAHQRLVITYQYLASIHRARGSYQQAIDYSFRALNYERQYYASRGEAGGDESLAYSRLAGSYWLLGKRALALSYYREAFENTLRVYRADPLAKSRLRKRLINMGLEISGYYRELAKGDSALYFLEQVRPYTLPDDPLRQELRLEQARTWSQMGIYTLAMDTLEAAVQVLQRATPSGKASLLLGRLLNARGAIDESRHSYPEALQAYQSALSHLSDNFASGKLQENPEVAAATAPRELLYTLTQKARLLLSHPPDESDDWLTVAWATANLGMDLVDSIKLSYTADYDKQYLLEDSYSLYELALQTAYRLGESYAGAALDIMERSKAIALFAAVRDLHARNYAGVPKAQLEKMRRIQYQLAKVDAQLAEAGSEEQQIGQRQKKLELKRAYDAMIRSFERDYPAYYRLKYERAAVNYNEVAGQGLLKGQYLVEYFAGPQKLYACVMDGNTSKIRLYELPWSAQLGQWAIDLKSDIYNREDRSFREKAGALYQALLAPVFPAGLPESLLIIPDGALGYLPFDILLTESIDAAQESNFRNYPYLLRQTVVSQNFSLSMLREMQMERTGNTQELLAFAPSFPAGEVIAARDDRAILGELLYNQAEAKAVLASFAGRLVADQEATKKQFLQLASRFRVYHIASHAVVDDEAPNRSFIAFSAAVGSNLNHDRLYSYEILAQNFPADLVVLSACETGIGKVLRGEGIMSLARAFSYAGARSILTSLWNINDQSSGQLMDSFYRHLKSGLPKDEALRRAKLDYLENAPDNARAHPKYWAAFLPMGDMEPLKSRWTWEWGMLLLVMAGFTYFATLKKRP